MNEQIYIALLDEGAAVWRPAPARKVGPDRYLVLQPGDYDPDGETWQFPPGTTVVCEEKRTADGVILAAVRRVETRRRTA